MSAYQFPFSQVTGLLNSVAPIEDLSPYFDDLNDLVAPVLIEAGKLCEQVIAPTNRIADTNLPVLNGGVVTVPPAIALAYHEFQQGGWNGVSAEVEYGGMGLPNLIATAVNEGIQSGNLAFSLCPLLTQGAIDAIQTHASDDLKQAYLPKLISGEWTATMNLTEPQAGTDLGAIKAYGEKVGDHYLIRGQKIFITWGEHNLTENIIHLVLAKTSQSSTGVKGLSLFLVPKFLLNENGSPSVRNDVMAISTEHKLGIHGSPTCVMAFGDKDGAVGYLVGAENGGIQAMFTMMNNARQAVGLQGVAVSERALQMAKHYAEARIQGQYAGKPAIIALFPDVHRMLSIMASSVAAMRAVTYQGAWLRDVAALPSHPDYERAQQFTGLYTPIIKGWCTELTQEVTSLGLQVHGGMGYVEETGVAQLVRDARILSIYEGTNGIQALDLAMRKILPNEGKVLFAAMDFALSKIEQPAGSESELEAIIQGRKAIKHIVAKFIGVNPETQQCVAFDLMMALGYWFGATLLVNAQKALPQGEVLYHQYHMLVYPRLAMHLSVIDHQLDSPAISK